MLGLKYKTLGKAGDLIGHDEVVEIIAEGPNGERTVRTEDGREGKTTWIRLRGIPAPKGLFGSFRFL